MKLFKSIEFAGRFMALLVLVGSLAFNGCGDDGGGGGGGSSDISVTAVTLNQTGTSITVGRSEQLTAAIEPADATNQNVTWSSTDDSKATVSSDGLVTAIASGTVVIIMRTEDGGYIAACTVTVRAPGEKIVFIADSVSFTMAYVPGKTFPAGTDDDETATVSKPYWIGETEVMYELWSAVYDWATGNGYIFANEGTMGDGEDADDTDKHPVTTVNWRDAMVFCNALTEWYNENNGTGYTCAYTYSGAVIRDSRDGNAAECDNAVAGSSATGFRLLTSNEWELAARWRSDAINSVIGYSNPWFTKGNSASGATADYSDEAASREVAYYWGDPDGNSPHRVGNKKANS